MCHPVLSVCVSYNLSGFSSSLRGQVFVGFLLLIALIAVYCFSFPCDSRSDNTTSFNIYP